MPGTSLGLGRANMNVNPYSTVGGGMINNQFNPYHAKAPGGFGFGAPGGAGGAGGAGGRIGAGGMGPGGMPGAPGGGGGNAAFNTQSGAGNQPPNFGGNPYGANGSGLGKALTTNYNTGAGLQDPNSDYYKRLMEAMRNQMGGQADAASRAAVLQNVQTGGSGNELMSNQMDIHRAGQEAAGNAGANLALQAPGMGAGIVQGTYAPALGMQNLAQQGYQFGQNMAFNQQQAANQNSQFQAQLQQQSNLQQQQLQMQQYLAQLNASMGGF